MGIPVIQPSNISREASVGNIIESIAMEQSSIAHILNAESEKLQKIIDSPNPSVDDLLAVNISVKNAVNATTRLEMALLSKLSLFSGMTCQTT